MFGKQPHAFVYNLPCLAATRQQNTTNNMKTIQKWFLPLFLLTAVTFLFPACEGNDADEAGVITLKMRNADHGGTSLDFSHQGSTHGNVRISNDNNFFVGSYSYGVNLLICDAGKKKLGSVRSVPSAGWVRELAVIPGHTYVAKINTSNYYNLPDFVPVEYYYKIYVVDWIESSSGGIIGANVKYCEWDPK